jgi:hypothetical protein
LRTFGENLGGFGCKAILSGFVNEEKQEQEQGWFFSLWRERGAA